jgi:hypothetical protein
VALDGGWPDVGLAMYEAGVLTRAAHISLKELPPSVCPPCRLKRLECSHGQDMHGVTVLCDLIEEWLGTDALDAGSPGMPDVFVAEEPVKFRQLGGGSGSLTKFGRVVAAMCDRAAAWPAEVYRYYPSEWKGNTAKPLHQSIALTQLREEERGLLPHERVLKRARGAPDWRYKTDPLDAAALGLWFLTESRYRTPKFHGMPGDFRPYVKNEPPKKTKTTAAPTWGRR